MSFYKVEGQNKLFLWLASQTKILKGGVYDDVWPKSFQFLRIFLGAPRSELASYGIRRQPDDIFSRCERLWMVI